MDDVAEVLEELDPEGLVQPVLLVQQPDRFRLQLGVRIPGAARREVHQRERDQDHEEEDGDHPEEPPQHVDDDAGRSASGKPEAEEGAPSRGGTLCC